MTEKRNLSFWQLFNLSFGFFGVQIAYALQSANISRIFATLGADPHDLSLFWVLPPLMGMIVQPLVGKYSDRTWCKLGRRKPYLLVGAIIAVIVMVLLPNANMFFTDETAQKVVGWGLLSFYAVIWFGIFALIFLDTSINIAMQPFKMMVGDMVSKEQRGLAYSIQSFLCNAGSLVGYLLPIFLTNVLGIPASGKVGEVAPSVQWAFYLGAAILILCVLYTFFAVKEMDPKQYAEFHGVDEGTKEEKAPGLVQLLIKAPSTFWTVGLVQFFSWAAFLYMWTYTTGATTQLAFKGEGDSAPTATMVDSYKDTISGEDLTCAYVQYDSLLIVEKKVLKHDSARIWLQTPGLALQVASVAETVKDSTGMEYLVLSAPKTFVVPQAVKLETKIDIDVTSKEYGDAGNWCGMLFAIQAVGSIIWALVIPYFRRRKFCYSLSLLLGAVGFASTYFVDNKWVLGISFLLIGCAWAAMLAIPFTIFTNSLKKHIGSYLGLFNCTICLPQIIAALVGPKILGLFELQNGVVYQPYMLVVAGVLLVLGAISVIFVKETKTNN
jgi:MFS family permease